MILDGDDTSSISTDAGDEDELATGPAPGTPKTCIRVCKVSKPIRTRLIWWDEKRQLRQLKSHINYNPFHADQSSLTTLAESVECIQKRDNY